MESLAQHLSRRHGGDMSGMNMGQSNSTSATMMSTYFTTSLGASNLWFSSWTPTSAGATFGACLGLFFLAILSRFLAAVKSCAEVAWAQSLKRQYLASRPPIPSPATPASNEDKSTPGISGDLDSILPTLPATPPSSTRSASPSIPFTPPFNLSIDLPRSLLFGLQSLIAYLLMLAIMSFSTYFFISILIGLVVGELCFGRFIALLGGAAVGGGHHGAEHL
ncbi:hypothetical protein JCM16303_006281 [Sporobolomyces ruberrimus]